MKKIWHIVILALVYSSPVAWLVLDSKLNAHGPQNNTLAVECNGARLSSCTTTAVSRLSIGGGLFTTSLDGFLE
jgi:hypothetical protein